MTRAERERLAIAERDCPLTSCWGRAGEPCTARSASYLQRGRQLKHPHEIRVSSWSGAQARAQELVRDALLRMVRCSFPLPRDPGHALPLYCRKLASSAVLDQRHELWWRCEEHEGMVTAERSGRVIEAS